MELNPTQKDLVLKIAELLCNNDITDGRAKYWVDRAAKLFPGSPSVFRLKVHFLNCFLYTVMWYSFKSGWINTIFQQKLYMKSGE